MSNPISGAASATAARFPLMELPSVAFLLALMAGAMNAWTLPNASTFATVQSGNVVSSGYWLVAAEWDKFMFPFISVIAFGLGSLACGIVMTRMKQRGMAFTHVTLGFIAVVLIVLGIMALTLIGDNPHGDTANVLNFGAHHPQTAQWMAIAVSFVAGAQGNAFHKTHGMLYGNVAVTFVVQMAFNFLIQSRFERKGINGTPNITWSGIFFGVLLGFAGGGAIGFALDKYVGNGVSLFLAALISVVLLAISFQRRLKNVDPTPGGSFA